MAIERNFWVELFWRWHPRIYRWSGGRIGGRMANLPVLLLETIGRRSTAMPKGMQETLDRAKAILEATGG